MKLYNIYPTEVANARWLEQEEDPHGDLVKAAEALEKVEALTKENVMLLEALEHCSSTLLILFENDLYREDHP